MKRQKKWKSREEIEKAIDAAHRKITRFKKVAQTAIDAEELFRGCDVNSARLAQEEADKYLGKISRLERTRLPKLQRLLSDFLTIQLGEKNGVEGLNETAVVLINK
jgi:hypothetical protein